MELSQKSRITTPQSSLFSRVRVTFVDFYPEAPESKNLMLSLMLSRSSSCMTSRRGGSVGGSIAC